MKISKYVSASIVSSFIFGGFLVAPFSQAETAVIVHPSNANTLSEKEIQRIFLGKVTTFPNGQEALPIDLPVANPNREALSSSVLNKSAQQIKAYWARLVFTGGGIPPKEVSDPKSMLELVATNPSTIGYIDAAMVDGSVKVAYKF